MKQHEKLKELERRTLSAYESARWKLSLKPIPLVLGVSALPLLTCYHEPLKIAFVSATLIAACSYFLQRGQALAKGVYPGLFVGGIATLAPIVLHAEKICCDHPIETPLSLVLSIFSGAAVLWMSRNLKQSLPGFLFSAGVVTTLSTGLTCVSMGTGPALVFLAGMLLIMGPALIRARAQA